MTEDEVATKTLVLQVFDWDLITGDDDIGEGLIILKWSFQFFAVQVRIPLANVNFQNGADQWVEIEKLTHPERQQWILFCTSTINSVFVSFWYLLNSIFQIPLTKIWNWLDFFTIYYHTLQVQVLLIMYFKYFWLSTSNTWKNMSHRQNFFALSKQNFLKCTSNMCSP